MSVPMKKPHTENVDIHFTGPRDNLGEAIKHLRSLGFVDNSDSVPWREIFPEFEGTPSYSAALHGARKRMGMTQKELAKASGIPQGHLSAMENGKKEIGKERAKRLAEVLDIDYRILL